HWRSRLPILLEDLATAWKDPAAWTGTPQAGGVTMPATALGHVAVNELIMHSWDLARATGQEYFVDPRTLEILIEFLAQFPAEGSPGLFGPVVPLDDEATLLDQALALAGRDAKWRPPRRRPIAVPAPAA
ncbi:MAG TPA: TIGR03086 family metal-binding protein, partial [Actinoplanes sp.]|nr:TIGR03086 family metal-binding protein [Actinoplanes sp.]